MKIKNVRQKTSKDQVIYLADFEFNDKGLNKTVWFEVPREFAHSSKPSDAFLVCAAPLALALNEPLEIDEPVSKQLVNNLKLIPPHLKMKRSRLKFTLNTTLKRKKSSQKAGVFFSLGVDSFHSLINNHAFRLAPRIDFLVFIKGLELYKPSYAFQKWIEFSLLKVARKTKTKAIIVNTNIRELSDKILTWDFYHGAGIAAAAHLLAGTVGTMFISSCDEYFFNAPFGTHKNLDPLWSSEAVQFQSAGTSYRKIDKVEEIVGSKHKDLFLNHMLTCWEIPARVNNRNCSHCEKCLRAMFSLLACAIPEPLASFHSLRKEDLMTMALRKGCFSTWEGIYERLKTNHSHIDEEIFEILEKKIFTYRSLKSRVISLFYGLKSIIPSFKLSIKKRAKWYKMKYV